MRHKVKQVLNASAWFVACTVLAIGFQNCSGYEPLYNPLYDNAIEADCVGVACAQSAEDLGLVIMNEKYMKLPAPASGSAADCSNPSYCFDLAGYCETGGFENTEITLQIGGPSGFSTPRPTIAKCEDGRFQVLIDLTTPSLGIAYDFTKPHNITLFIKAVDSDGRVIDNPLQTNYQTVILQPE